MKNRMSVVLLAAAVTASAAPAAAVAETRVDYRSLSPEQLAGKLKKLEQQMYKHAQDLEFEAAGKVRDEIKRIKEQALASG